MTKASDQNRRKPRRVGLRHQAAPTVDIDIAPDQVDDLQRELAEFPDLREIMAYNGDEDGVDGHYGPRTYRAIALIAREAGIPESQIPTINFRGKSGELYTKWQAASRIVPITELLKYLPILLGFRKQFVNFLDYP
jgi:peptidoglycan hydrolase-like protein with peptidoglycan-binding domain